MNEMLITLDPDSQALPAHYDPGKGLKTIATAEAAENFYRRAKDTEKLYEAIETKLSEQRNFVLWWDQQEKAQGLRTDLKRRNGSVTTLLRADLPVSPMQLSRWRTRLKDHAAFAATLEAARERCRRVCEAEKDNIALKYTGDPEWYTPSECIEAARAVMGGIDLDPASNATAQKVVKAAVWYGVEDDGLAQEWTGRIFLNPPYSYPLIAHFIDKLLCGLQEERIEQAVLLTNNKTDTRWWQASARKAEAICFTAGRMHFYKADGGQSQPAMNGQTFFYFGPDASRFIESFSQFGISISLLAARQPVCGASVAAGDLVRAERSA